VLRLFEAATGAHLGTIDELPAAVVDARFLPDGSGVATLTSDGLVRHWPLDAVSCARSRQPHPMLANDLARFGIAEGAELEARRAEEILASRDVLRLWVLGDARRRDGDMDGALEAMRRAAAERPRYFLGHHGLACVYTQRALSWPDDPQGRAERTADLDRAVASIAAGIDLRDGVSWSMLATDPVLQPLRELPAFRALSAAESARSAR
jgi:hypothetical protein